MKTPKPPERAAHNVHCRSDGRLISTGQHGGGGGDLCNVGRLPQEERLAGWQLAARWLLPALLLLLLLLACPGALRLRQLSPAARQQAAVVWGTGGGNLPPEQLLELGLSSHTCNDAQAPVDRVCAFQSLVLHQGQLYYVSQDPAVDIPIIDVHYLGLKTDLDTAALFGPKGFGLEVVTPQQLPWGSGAVRGRVLDNVYLWQARMGDNLAHGLGEEVISMHNSMCKYLGSCSFADRNQQHVVLLNASRLLPAVNNTISRCMSRPPLLTVQQWSDWVGPQGVALLRNATVGVGPDCRAMMDCRPKGEEERNRKVVKRQQQMRPEMVALWRQRIGDCMGFDAAEEASLQPLRVVVIDRPYEAARHFLNIRSIQQRIQDMLPAADVRVVYMEDLPIHQQVQAVHRASILLQMHGAALGLWPFLPRKAVAIHVVPYPYGDNVQKWGRRMAETLAVPANISFVPLTNRRPALMVFHMDEVRRSKEYRTLTLEQRLALLQDSKCPEELRAHCAMFWMKKAVDLELDLGQLEEAMWEALRQLAAKFPPEETAGLEWARGLGGRRI